MIGRTMRTLALDCRPALREARWLDGARVRAYRLILLGVTIVVACGWLAAAHGGRDPAGKAIGTDFVAYWAAARLALAGTPAAVYDMASQHAAERAAFGFDPGLAPFYYPPPYLLLCLPLGLLPYVVALGAWTGATGAAYLLVVRRWLAGSRARVLTILAFPAVLVNAGHGQNGFLSAALTGGALLLLRRRPWIAGLLFGTLALKPQLAIVVPLVLLARGEWRALAGAAIGLSLWCVAATAAFGMPIWSIFLTAGTTAARAQLELGLVDPAKMTSLFAALRVLGAGLPLAYGAQAAMALATVAALLWLAYRRAAADAQNAALAAGMLLLSPYVFDYDLTMLALPLAWLFIEGRRRGFAPWEKLLLALGFVLPLFGRGLAMAFGLPVAPLVLAGVFWAVWRAADRTRAEPIRA